MCTFITEAERQRRLRSGRWKHALPEPAAREEKSVGGFYPNSPMSVKPMNESECNITPFPEINWLLFVLLGTDEPIFF